MDKDKIDIKDLTQSSKKKLIAPSSKSNPTNRIYVRAFFGLYQQIRRYMGWFFILLFVCIPWFSYGGRQGILFDLSEQKFYFFGTTLWPQDLYLLAVLFMLAAFGLFFITTFLGRVWCGYLCPQSVWSFIFIWFEEKLEGNANKRRRQDSLPLTNNLRIRKALKHCCWLGIALITGLTFIGYFVPIRSLIIDFLTFNASFWSVFWVLFFTFCTYLNAGWMRSVVCLHICPYARFQSAMFDNDTFVVAYDSLRGEKRGPRSRKTNPKNAGLGDCIDCHLCVEVCPTGIDIRDGLQYECINCGACVDACNHSMQKMGYSKHLISYTTEHKLQGKKLSIIRPKLIGYAIASLTMLGLMLFLIQRLEPMLFEVSRDRNQLYKINPEGLIENTYHLKVINKTQHKQSYRLSVSGLENPLWYGKQSIELAAGEVYHLPISLGANFDDLTAPITKILFKLESQSSENNQAIYAESRFISQF